MLTSAHLSRLELSAFKQTPTSAAIADARARANFRTLRRITGGVSAGNAAVSRAGNPKSILRTWLLNASLLGIGVYLPAAHFCEQAMDEGVGLGSHSHPIFVAK